MKLLEGQVASVISGNGFDPQMKIANVVFKHEAIPERVEVKYEGDWWKAKLLERRGTKGLVQWFEIGWDAPEDDTWVPLKTVRALKGGTARGVDYTKKSSAQSAGDSSSFSINQKVLALSEGKYYPAVIQKVDGQRYLVHYVDYDKSSDEWLGIDRMKRRKNPSTHITYSVSQKVAVLSDGDWYPAVIKRADGKRYFVHYDDYDKSNDEWVGADRVKKR
jgi:RNA binding activity-knot of a chromodomain.